WQRNAHFGFSGRVGTLGLRLEPGTNHGMPNTDVAYTADQAPGLDRQPRYIVAGGAVTLDYRDRPHLTTEGTFGSVALWHARPRAGDEWAGGWRRLVTEL